MDMYKCDRCNKLTNADSSGERYARIVFEDTARQTSWYHLCPECEKYFYTNFLNWVWNNDDMQYEPKESINEKT